METRTDGEADHHDEGWKATWKDHKAGSVLCEGGKKWRHLMAMPQPVGDALETLLGHYPFIVYFAYVFWRKLVLRVWQPPDDVWVDELFVDGLYTCRVFGALGDLGKFSKEVLPPIFLQHHQELSVANWQSSTHAQSSVENDRQSKNGGDFLFGLMRSEQLDVIQILVEELRLCLPESQWSHANKRCRLEQNQSVLHIALSGSRSRHITVYLLRKLQGLANVTTTLIDKNGWTLLHWAAFHGHDEATATLLEDYAANPTVEDTNGNTPQYWATLIGHKKVVAMLTASAAEQEERRAGTRTF